MTSRRPVRRSATALLVAAGVLATALGACGEEPTGDGSTSGSGASEGTPLVVVTTSVLADLVGQLVGDGADVRLIVPNGQDPHDYEASARDVEAIGDAALVVTNGLGLEEALAEVIEQAQDDGARVFTATDHVPLRHVGEGEVPEGEEPGGEEPEGEEHGAAGHDHEGEDPHIWTDPLTMAELVDDLAAELGDALGDDLTARAGEVEATMREIDAAAREIMARVPAGGCVLVTGHDSLGYFADRYGCTVVGAVIPSLSSTAETSARALAELHETAEAAGARAIFTEVGTPEQLAEQVADELGVPLVELRASALPDEGGYRAFVLDLATGIASALAG